MAKEQKRKRHQEEDVARLAALQKQRAVEDNFNHHHPMNFWIKKIHVDYNNMININFNHQYIAHQLLVTRDDDDNDDDNIYESIEMLQ